MNITYSFEKRPTADEIIELYDNTGLPRPTYDKERIQKMFDNSNLIVTAWDEDLLVGVSRSITDWVWACYLSDLAVRHDYKNEGIGQTTYKPDKGKSWRPINGFTFISSNSHGILSKSWI